MKNQLCQLVIFGVSGDLAKRKILPAIARLILDGNLPYKLQIVGVTRQAMSVKELLKSAKNFFSAELSESACEKLVETMSLVNMDLKNPMDYQKLKIQLNTLGTQNIQRLFYFSTPVAIFKDIVMGLAKVGLNKNDTESSVLPRILIEKPFGKDLVSAQVLADVVQEYFQTNQIYLVDHYLFKEMVQDLLTLRLNNSLFQAIWRTETIESIKISLNESLKIEDRIEFYEQTGALRDMGQNHALEILALMTMELSKTFNETNIHQTKLDLLNKIRLVKIEKAIRAQYLGYREEVNNPNSFTETFARFELNIDNERWAKTKIIIETGKALDCKKTQVEVTLRPTSERSYANVITFQLQPITDVTVCLQSKKPGFNNDMMELKLKTEPKEYKNTEYEHVLLNALLGNQTFFVPIEETLALWRIVEPLVEKWKKDDVGLIFYKQGTRPDGIG